MPALCLILAEDTLESLTEKVRRYDGVCPFLEVRLDHLLKPEALRLSGNRRSRFIATCRPVRHGGRFTGDERSRLNLLRQAASLGFDWLDLEHDSHLDSLPPHVKIARSYHDFSEFPPSLDALFGRLESAGGDVFKAAVTIRRTEELVQSLNAMEGAIPGRRILIGMGAAGLPTRLLGHFLGNAWTYVVETTRSALAPGQFSLDEARRSYRLDYEGGDPVVYGILGNPLAHSLSPALHNRLFRAYDMDKVYLPFQLTSLAPWFDYLSGSRVPFEGFSVTLPFKSAVIKYAGLGADGEEAINTLVRDGRQWRGLNTDRAGFLAPIRRLDLEGKTAVVLGAGGVAHTVVRALAESGMHVTVAGRDAEKLRAFSARYNCPHVSLTEVPAAYLCVNCTPVGQYPASDGSPLAEDQLNFEWVYDLVYHPEKTRLLVSAKAKGARTISGLAMFVEQAALQFEAWTGVRPDREMVAETVRQLLPAE